MCIYVGAACTYLCAIGPWSWGIGGFTHVGYLLCVLIRLCVHTHIEFHLYVLLNIDGCSNWRDLLGIYSTAVLPCLCTFAPWICWGLHVYFAVHWQLGLQHVYAYRCDGASMSHSNLILIVAARLFVLCAFARVICKIWFVPRAWCLAIACLS